MVRQTWLVRSVTLLVALVIAGCTTPAPDLARLYRSSDSTAIQPPLILIPGLLGSRLLDAASGREAWPGGLTRLLFGDYSELALRFDPVTLRPLPDGLVAGGLFESAPGRDFYGDIVETLELIGGYRRSRPGVPVTDRTRRYYVLAYDWRQDNVESARALAAMIEQIRRDYSDPDLKVDIIAHSMGGLITRYYLRYGAADVLTDNEFPVTGYGAERVRRVVLLGTPNLGSVATLHAFIEGNEVAATEVLATMPSLYQLFPHPINDWIISARGETLDRDPFSTRVWQAFGWSVYSPEVRERIRRRFDDPRGADAYLSSLEAYFEEHIERARRFVWSLTVSADVDRTRLIVMGGDCHFTPARIVVEDIGNESHVRLWPREIRHPLPDLDYEALMLEPGDSRVTKASLLARQALDPGVQRHRYSHFPLAYPIFLCARHDQLAGNVHFRDNLLHALLSRDE